MQIAEKLARLTAGSLWKSEKLDRSIDSLPPDLLAGALPKDRLQRSIVMAKYLGDESEKIMAGKILHIVMPNLTKPPKGVYILRAIAHQAIIEIVDETKCRKCNGRGEVWVKSFNRPMTCDVCLSSGKRSLDTLERYRAIQNITVKGVEFDNLDQITESDWKRKWQRVFDDNYVHALNAHNDGIRYLVRQLHEVS